MKIKYSLSLILVIVMLLLTALPTVARTFDIDINNSEKEMQADVSYVWDSIKISGDGDSKETDIEYTISQYYEVNIPAAVELAEGEEISVNLSANKVVVAKDKALVFRVSSENYDNGWTLVGTDDNREKYSIKAGGAELSNNDVAFSCPGGTTHKTSELIFEPIGKGKAGSYTDTLTFSIALEEITN